MAIIGHWLSVFGCVFACWRGESGGGGDGGVESGDGGGGDGDGGVYDGGEGGCGDGGGVGDGGIGGDFGGDGSGGGDVGVEIHIYGSPFVCLAYNSFPTIKVWTSWFKNESVFAIQTSSQFKASIKGIVAGGACVSATLVAAVSHTSMHI